MDSIWKYGLDIADTQELPLPLGAEILSVGVQNDNLVLWAICDPYQQTRSPRTIEIFGTGHSIDRDTRRKFIGTVQMSSLVWHIFEVL
jgi:hypothetical protein